MNKQLLTLSAILTLGGISLADTSSTRSAEIQTKQSVAESLTGNTHILEGSKLTPTQLNQNTDYYFVYYAASW